MDLAPDLSIEDAAPRRGFLYSVRRLLRYVYCADATLVDDAVVRRGYAQSSAYPPNVAHQDLFMTAQRKGWEAKREL